MSACAVPILPPWSSRSLRGRSSVPRSPSSQELFATAPKLAANRGLLDTGAVRLPESRAEVAAKIREVLGRIEQINVPAVKPGPAGK